MRPAFIFWATFMFVSFVSAYVPNRKTTAAASKSYNINAPLYGQNELMIALAMVTGNTDATPAGSRSDFSGFATKIDYSYGLNDFIAPFFAQSYFNLEQAVTNPKTDINQKGIGSTKLGFKGVISFKKPYLNYEISYTAGIFNRASSNCKNTSCDLAPVGERPNISMLGGAGMPYGLFDFGTQLAYLLYQDGDNEFTGSNIRTTTKYKSGTGLTFEVYAQLNMGWKLGVTYSEKKIDEFNTVTSGITSISNTSTDTFITGYGILYFGSANEAILSVAKQDNKEATTTKYNLFQVIATYRRIF